MNKNKDYYQKQREYKSNIVGQDFHTRVRDANHVCVSLAGEILEARNFDGDNLFIQWEFKLPDYWEVDNQDLLELEPQDYENVQLDEWNRLKSITHQCEVNTHKSDDGNLLTVAHFCFPFDLQLQVNEKALNEKFPVLLMQINSIDSWERNRVEGYGFVEIPHTPGFHQLTVKTYKPNDDLFTRIYEYFLGGAIKVKEFWSLSNSYFIDKYNDNKQLNRYSLDTESSGEVIIRVNVAIQKESYKELNMQRFKQQEHDELFNKIREKRMMNQTSKSSGLPTAMIKTDVGLVNRYNNTQLPFQ